MTELAKGDRTRSRILDEAVDLASIQGIGSLTIGPLAEQGRAVILRKGKAVDPRDFKGVYRITAPRQD